MTSLERRFLKYTQKDIQSFLKKLGPEEFRSKQNYFRWLEYPLALSLADPKAEERILEVGSGYINILPLYCAWRFGAKVTAVDQGDFSEEERAHIRGLVDRLGISHGNLDVMQADGAKLPFPDASFDLVFCVSTLEHIPLDRDSRVMMEIGRVLAPGGRAIISFPFNHHGKHIESESWHGDEYTQRHYNEYTTRWRVAIPSGLWFKKAVIFGERDQAVGKDYLAMSPKERFLFCRKNAARWDRFWKIYYQVERDEFYINEDEIPDEIARVAGIIFLKMEKRDEEPARNFFDYNPFEFYLQNNGARKTMENSGKALDIESVRILNDRGDQMDVFESGQTCRVQIRFTVRGDIYNPVFYLAFHDRRGHPITGLNTFRAGCDFGALSGTHTLTVSFGMLNLLGGGYDLTVGAWEYEGPNPIPPFPFDVHYRRYLITVKDRMPGLFGTAYSPYRIDFE